MTRDEIRAEFEAWAKRARLSVGKSVGGDYLSWHTHISYSAYLAAAEPREQRIAELESQTCHHGWRGTSPDAPSITTPCPTCGGRSLFIGNGGHLTCARVPGQDGSGGCSEPGVENAVDKLKARIAELEASDAYTTEQWLRDNASNSAANSLLRERIAELEKLSAGLLTLIGVAKVERERIAAKVTHCDNCGDSWYDSGICAASCPHCRLARLREAAKAVQKIADRNTDEFNALRAALDDKQEPK
jgi:Zn finger protein HypA/HybF involved in hydrogenase expression